MTLRLGVTIDCADPAALAGFWRDLLGYVDDPPPPGYAGWAEYDAANAVPQEKIDAGFTIVDPRGVAPRLYFQRVPEPKVAKNRVHLDVDLFPDLPAGEREHRVREAADRAVRAGAVRVGESDDPLDPFIVLRDPEGNEFCLVWGAGPEPATGGTAADPGPR